MTLLSVRNLCMSIGDRAVLRHISFSVNPGEIVALVGDSGSGKSMTVRSIMRLPVDGCHETGHIVFDGVDMFSCREKVLNAIRGWNMTMISQNPLQSLNPVMTVGDQAVEVLSLHGKMDGSSGVSKIRAVFDDVGSREWMGMYPHQLSGGQLQRVCIAMAMLSEPRLVLADEPMTALDAINSLWILEKLRSCVDGWGAAILLVTHDISAALPVADRYLVMRDGEVVERTARGEIAIKGGAGELRSLLRAAYHVPRRPSPKKRDPMVLLEVRDVVCGYDRGNGVAESVNAVDGVSFDACRGEIVGLIGESGSGKSTLVHAIAGLKGVRSGRISIGGERVFPARVPGNLQIVFQDPYASFNPRRKVSFIVGEPLHVLGKSAPRRAERDKAIGQVLEAVGLDARDGNRFIHSFSGGELQRIALARALIGRPALLILDEPLSSIDTRTRMSILDVISDLIAEFSLTCLLVSHDLHIVRGMADRVLVMRQGKFVEQGETDRVFTQPLSAYGRELSKTLQDRDRFCDLFTG